MTARFYCKHTEKDDENADDINIRTNRTETDSTVPTTVKVNGQGVTINQSAKPTKTEKRKTFCWSKRSNNQN